MESGTPNLTSICLHKGERLHVSLTHYAANSTMAPHDHDLDQITFLLAGELRESVGSHEVDVYTPAHGVKRAGVCHADRYGPNGALLLSINQESDGCDTAWQWRAGNGVAASLARMKPISRLRNESNHVLRADIVWDLIAIGDEGDVSEPCHTPSPWLQDVRAQLIEQPGVTALSSLARSAGVHPVHLSRAFNAAFGLPPSTYRSRCRLARALSGLFLGRTAATAANDAGFSDQSHFARAVKQEFGVTPKEFQALMAA